MEVKRVPGSLELASTEAESDAVVLGGLFLRTMPLAEQRILFVLYYSQIKALCGRGQREVIAQMQGACSESEGVPKSSRVYFL